MELYKKYRPKELKDLYGNRQLVNQLKSKIKAKNIPHAILLTGASGCGKTSIARILKNELECGDFDYTELDSAQFRGIDTVRSLLATFHTRPVNGKTKVYLIDEIHNLGQGGNSKKNLAQTALLKGLEDTPSHVYVILATTNPEMIIPTIKSRCTHYEVNPISDNDMEELLLDVCSAEDTKIPPALITKIIDASEGHCRKALVYLDTIINLKPADMKLALSLVVDEVADTKELIRALLEKKSWNFTAKILRTLQKNKDSESIRRALLGYCNSMLIGGWGGQPEKEYELIELFREPYYDCADAGLTADCYEYLTRA